MKNPSTSTPASASLYTSPMVSPHSSIPHSPRSEPPASPRSPRAQPTHWPPKSAAHASTPAPTNAPPTMKKLAIPALNVPSSQSPAQSPVQSTHSKPQSNPPHLNLHAVPQPQSLPQPQPLPQKPHPHLTTPPASSQSDAGQQKGDLKNKNKEAAYLSYPEGEDEDGDEEIDEELYDLDGDLDFEDDEDIEIDAAPLVWKAEDKAGVSMKGEAGKSAQPPKAPLASPSKPAAPLHAPAKNGDTKKQAARPTAKDNFDMDEEDDPGSLEEDMKRLEVIEQKLNLFTNKPLQTQLKPSTTTPTPATAASTATNKHLHNDDDLESIGSDYSHSFESDDGVTVDHSIGDHNSIYDHEEDIDA